ncbi:hypothetical protein MHBO_003413, partial [Bonamia ostreae]
ITEGIESSKEKTRSRRKLHFKKLSQDYLTEKSKIEITENKKNDKIKTEKPKLQTEIPKQKTKKPKKQTKKPNKNKKSKWEEKEERELQQQNLEKLLLFEKEQSEKYRFLPEWNNLPSALLLKKRLSSVRKDLLNRLKSLLQIHEDTKKEREIFVKEFFRQRSKDEAFKERLRCITETDLWRKENLAEKSRLIEKIENERQKVKEQKKISQNINDDLDFALKVIIKNHLTIRNEQIERKNKHESLRERNLAIIKKFDKKVLTKIFFGNLNFELKKETRRTTNW